MARTRLAAVSCFVGLVLSASCLADGLARDDYMELLEGAVTKAAGRGKATRLGDAYFGLMGAGLAMEPAVKPVEGLGTPEGAPFLVDMVKHGPLGSKVLTGDYVELAQCYAALCLGEIGDRRGIPPLLEALKVEGVERPSGINLPTCAARALVSIGDCGPIVRRVMPLLRDEREEVRERAAWTASWLVEQPLSEVATQGRQLVGEPGQAATRILAATFERTATELARMLQEPGSRADVAVIEEVSSGLQKVVAELQKRAESDRDERVRAAARKALAEVRDVVGPLDIEPEGEK